MIAGESILKPQETNSNGASTINTRHFRMPSNPDEADYISYLGVKLRRRNDNICVPDPNQFADHVISNYDRNLEQKVAVAFDLSQPVLMESGSGIGKTSLIDRMCAQLGWNSFYANCSRYEPDILIGADRTREDTKSGLGWVDGVVTSAIRNGGVLVLDEYNFMKMETQGRLHEILDAVLNGKKYITLPENGGERVKVHENLRIVCLQNPLDSYIDRQELDKSNLSRFVYIKEPEDLPDEVWRIRTLSAIGSEVDDTYPILDELKQREDTSSRDLGKLEGMASVLEQYREFHVTIENLVEGMGEGQRLGSEQGQPVHFVYSRDLKRVLSFISRYHCDNPVEAIHRALEYYYVNRFESPTDREKVRELINLISLATAEDISRKTIGKDQATGTDANGQHSSLSINEGTTPVLDSSIQPVEYYQILRQKGLRTEAALASLCGDDSDAAFEIRSSALKNGASLVAILRSLKCVGGKEADAYRIKALENGADLNVVIGSLIGAKSEHPNLSLHTLAEQALDISVDNSTYDANLEALGQALIGRDDTEAAEVRKMILSGSANFLRALRTTFYPLETNMWRLKGDNAEPIAWVGTLVFPVRIGFSMYMQHQKALSTVIESYAGVTSDEANQLRKRYVDHNQFSSSVAISLAGLDRDIDWIIRNKALESRGTHSLDHLSVKALSVALVDSARANEIRTDFGNYRDYPDCYFADLDTSHTVSWRDYFLNKSSQNCAYLIRSPFTIALKRALARQKSA